MQTKSKVINTTNKWSETQMVNKIIEALPEFDIDPGSVLGKVKIDITVTRLSGKKKTKRVNNKTVKINE